MDIYLCIFTVNRVDVERSVEGNGLAWLITFRGLDALSSTMMAPLLVNGINIEAATDGKVSNYASYYYAFSTYL
jgi:hypothetical protein